MRNFIGTGLVLTLFAAATPAALAQSTHGGHGGHGGHAGHGAQAANDDSAATRAYRAANDRMHGAMDIPFTGNADADFIRGMIPHHEGAVDMARIVIEHGTDAEVRAFAEAVLAAQEAEIAWMRDWLSKRGM